MYVGPHESCAAHHICMGGLLLLACSPPHLQPCLTSHSRCHADSRAAATRAGRPKTPAQAALCCSTASAGHEPG